MKYHCLYEHLETKMQISIAFFVLPRNTCIRVRRTAVLEVLLAIRYGIDQEKCVPLLLGKHRKEKPARTVTSYSSPWVWTSFEINVEADPIYWGSEGNFILK